MRVGDGVGGQSRRRRAAALPARTLGEALERRRPVARARAGVRARSMTLCACRRVRLGAAEAVVWPPVTRATGRCAILNGDLRRRSASPRAARSSSNVLCPAARAAAVVPAGRGRAGALPAASPPPTRWRRPRMPRAFHVGWIGVGLDVRIRRESVSCFPEDEVGCPPRQRRHRSVEVAGDHDRQHGGVHDAQVSLPRAPAAAGRPRRRRSAPSHTCRWRGSRSRPWSARRR